MTKAVHFTKSIKTVVVVYRPDSRAAKKSAVTVAKQLMSKKINVLSHPKQQILTKIKKLTTDDLPNVDLAIVLGGDGTYLEAVRLLDGEKTPILGINMGSLGFLANFRHEDLKKALQLLLQKKLEMRPRSMLEVKVKRGKRILTIHRALNDVVIERGAYSQLINIAMYSEKHLINQIKADGLVIATPTGSTAYNLAAGGPIAHPHMRITIVTPICPHSLTHRPLVFPDHQVLTFKILNKQYGAFLNVDGQNYAELRSDDEVIVTRAACDHFVLRAPGHNFFHLLRTKLRFGERD